MGIQSKIINIEIQQWDVLESRRWPRASMQINPGHQRDDLSMRAENLWLTPKRDANFTV